MRTVTRYIPAIVLFVVYVMIVASPLAPLALRSPVIAHALTGECVSDCSICGCSPERRANHTCCCSQKKKLQAPDDDMSKPECCRKKHESKRAQLTVKSCPCGSGKILAFFGVEQSELIPSHFKMVLPTVSEASLYAHLTVCRADWPDEPPDPPPRRFRTIYMYSVPTV